MSTSPASPQDQNTRLTIYRGFGPFNECRQLIDLAENKQTTYAFAFIAAVRALEEFIDEMRLGLEGCAAERREFEDAVYLSKEVKDSAALAFKIQVLALSLMGRPFPRGEQLMQDFTALVEIRNQMVHPKTVVLRPTPRTNLPGFLAHLQNRRIIGPVPPALAVNLPQWLYHKPVAEWALAAATAMRRALFDAVPESNLKTILRRTHPDLAGS